MKSLCTVCILSKEVVWPAIIMMFISLNSFAQNNAEPSSINQYRPETIVTVAGEVVGSDYGIAVSFPVLWIKSSVKVTPLVGMFWEDAAEDGNDFNPAVGVRALYYLKPQMPGTREQDSFYVGVGGMSSEINMLGREYTERSRFGLVAGYDSRLSSAVRIAPELRMVFDQNETPFLSGGVVIHFGH